MYNNAESAWLKKKIIKIVEEVWSIYINIFERCTVSKTAVILFKTILNGAFLCPKDELLNEIPLRISYEFLIDWKGWEMNLDQQEVGKFWIYVFFVPVHINTGFTSDVHFPSCQSLDVNYFFA